ncbi:CE1759 family FMN reductase [Brevibacterium ihuae]|uniref:CE1759 family FMN reductase n=1 Tax=Brevibacterium ihuae TaxID=1631743 RepID=UPI000C78F31B|nr:CE1759 family FMN reductase [Brevibacterium ihuae]
MTYRIVAVSGGTGDPSNSTALAERILAAVREQLRPVGAEAEIEIIELRPLAHDLVDMTLTGIASEALESAFERIRTAHGLVIVTPVYNAAPLGLVSLFWQLFPDAGLRGIPVALAATGGTSRHSLVIDAQLRPLVAYLKGLAVPTSVFAATDDWGAPEAVSGMGGRVRAVAEELAELVAAQPAETRSVFDDLDPEAVTPFDQLLGT